MLNGTVLEQLTPKLRGQLIGPEDAAYDDARAVWNGMIDRRPALIVRCAGATDVIHAVRLAREHDLVVAVRGGGHNIAGSAVCDDGLVIDLSAMRAVRVDPAGRIARVQGGATLGDLDHETAAFGLATPGGVVSTTGVAGLTLGGGFGWLARKHGLAVDNLLSVDLITADGRLVTASAHEEPELFWAVRGGGGNFGVVTSFEFRLHPLRPEVLFGPTLYRLEDAARVLRTYRDFAAQAPRDCCVWADLLTAPPLPFLPERHHGTKVLSLMQFWAGDVAEGEVVLAPLRGCAESIGDAVGPTTYTAAQSILDEAYAKGARNYWSGHNFVDLLDPVIDALVEAAVGMPTVQSDITVSQVGGAIRDVAADATAYPSRGAAFVVTPGARWTDPAQDGACIAWVREACATVAGHAAGGTYVNFIAEPEGRERDAYGVNYDRLAALKARYDPDNFFRLNQNVPPAR
jgi:FAD/FMN-containing dehydrogenase